MPSLLYPAMQKLYSSLSSLDKFSKDSNFFENISNLDTFFSEYRNITFVLQKSLAHTEYIHDYEELRNKYLSECKWFIEKRNETIKQQPFQLEKKIKITIYFPDKGIEIDTFIFNVENDVEISTFLDKFKQIFTNINPYEVFFSSSFSFYEKDKDEDIFDKLIFGIDKIKSLLSELENRINSNCELCIKLKQEISKFKFDIFPRDILLVTDYVYYPKEDIFERAGRIVLIMKNEKLTLSKIRKDVFLNGPLKNIGSTLFDKFVFMHIIQKNIEIMPAIMTVYNNNTFEIDAFNADIKTTNYRKLNETAIKIKRGGVQEVFYMQVYSYIPFNDKIPALTSIERLKNKNAEDILVFMKIDKFLNEEEYIFEGKNITCDDYLISTFINGKSDNLNIGKTNMQPIKDAFESNKEKTH